MHDIRTDGIQEFDERLDQQRLAQLVPPMIVALTEEQEFVLSPVESGIRAPALNNAGVL